MRWRCTRVARPTRTSSRPVANGSSVPAWPTRRRGLDPSCRRTAATMSCEVLPAGLSTSRSPSCAAGGGSPGSSDVLLDLDRHAVREDRDGVVLGLGLLDVLGLDRLDDPRVKALGAALDTLEQQVGGIGPLRLPAAELQAPAGVRIRAPAAHHELAGPLRLQRPPVLAPADE